MKTLLLFLGLSISAFGLAQATAELTIAGVSSDAQNKILAGDRIGYYTFDNGGGAKNLKVKIETDNGRKSFFESVDVRPDASGKYDFNQVVKIKETSRVSFDDEMTIFVSMETIFGNAVWTKVKRTKANLSEPIILDQYSEKVGKDFEPRKRLTVNFNAIAYDDDFKKEVRDKGDGWSNRKKEHFHFYLKNIGDSDWKIDHIMKFGSITNGFAAEGSIPYNGELNLDKKIILRAEVETEKGNILWEEVELESRELTKVYFATNYAEKNAGTDTPSTDGGDAPNLSSNTDNTDGSDNSDNTTAISKPTNDKPGTTTVGTDNVRPTGTSQGATDLVTKTVTASCDKMVAGDSLVSVGGSTVCVRSLKPQGKKWMAGQLALDCNFEMNGVIFPIKGGEQIVLNKADGKLVQAVLRASIVYPSKAGNVTLKEGSTVKFKNNQLIGGSLAENAQLVVGELTLEGKPNAAQEQDIRFDAKGNLVECTIANAVAYSVAGMNFNFPESSRLIYKGGALSKVFCLAKSEFDFNGKTLRVAADNRGAAYIFRRGAELQEVISDEGNAIEIQGQTVTIQSGTAIRFTMEEGKAAVEKFIAGQEVTLKVTKGKNEKETVVKAGKKIVIKNGTVVKAG